MMTAHTTPKANELSIHYGGCHCGSVQFSVYLDTSKPQQVEDCNCSICAMSGNDHIIVPARNFELTAGADNLSHYQFNTKVAEHSFCKTCGVKSFYRPRSNPDGYAVTWRCLDDWRKLRFEIDKFDGVNWEANAAKLAHLSE